MDRYGETSHDCMEASVGALDVSKPSPWYQVNERSRGCGSAGAIVGPPARAGASDAGTCLEVGTALVMAPSAGAGPVIIRVAGKKSAIDEVRPSCRRIVPAFSK
jgi:hypothetical protein